MKRIDYVFENELESVKSSVEEFGCPEECVLDFDCQTTCAKCWEKAKEQTREYMQRKIINCSCPSDFGFTGEKCLQKEGEFNSGICKECWNNEAVKDEQ